MNSELTVELISWTQNPRDTLASVWDAAQKAGDFLRPNERENEEEDKNLFMRIISSQIPVGEMVDFIFVLDNVPISLREQLVRHRVGVKIGPRLGCDIIPDLDSSTWWSQSMRVIDMGSFAEEGRYHIPETIAANPDLVQKYRSAMDTCAATYNLLVAEGIPKQDARGLVPLAATHRLVWKLNLMTLLHIVSKRSCWIAQLGVWGPLIKGMINELCDKVDPCFRQIATPPCFSGGEFTECKFPVYTTDRIRGTDPFPPCPLCLYNDIKFCVNDNVGFESSAEDVWHMEAGTLPGQITWYTLQDDSRQIYSTMAEEYSRLWGRDVFSGELL